MKQSEFSHILSAIIILTIIASFSSLLKAEWQIIPIILVFSIIIIAIHVFTKKLTAYLLDSNVEHEIWQMQNFGFKKSYQLKKPIPAGIIFPLVVTILSLGTIIFSPILTYETRALKHRASKRFGFYSFREMTDWHNALIGASSIFALILLTIISYLLPYNLETLSKLSIYYAFWNLLPISKLDGTQIFFGSRVLWTILTTIVVIAVFLALTII